MAGGKRLVVGGGQWEHAVSGRLPVAGAQYFVASRRRPVLGGQQCAVSSRRPAFGGQSWEAASGRRQTAGGQSKADVALSENVSLMKASLVCLATLQPAGNLCFSPKL